MHKDKRLWACFVVNELSSSLVLPGKKNLMQIILELCKFFHWKDTDQ